MMTADKMIKALKVFGIEDEQVAVNKFSDFDVSFDFCERTEDIDDFFRFCEECATSKSHMSDFSGVFKIEGVRVSIEIDDFIFAEELI